MALNDIHEIAIIDISAFISNSSIAARDEIAIDFARFCRPNGCVGIVGHELPSSLLYESFAIARKLFDLPLEDKMKAPHPDGVVPHRGYSGIGREQGAATGAADTDDKVRKEELMKVKDFKVCLCAIGSTLRISQKVIDHEQAIGNLRDWE